jgi:hypothetical protein
MIEPQKAIVLGGTRPHIHLLDRLKARGFSIDQIKYFENPIRDVLDANRPSFLELFFFNT